MQSKAGLDLLAGPKLLFIVCTRPHLHSLRANTRAVRLSFAGLGSQCIDALGGIAFV